MPKNIDLEFEQLVTKIVKDYFTDFSKQLRKHRYPGRYTEECLETVKSDLIELHDSDNVVQTTIFLKSRQLYDSDKRLNFGQAIKFYCKANKTEAEVKVDVLARMMALTKVRDRLLAKLRRLEPIDTDSYLLYEDENVIYKSGNRSSFNNAIKIKKEYIKPLYSFLKVYFSYGRRNDLFKILNGDQINLKLIFESNSNKFVDVFWFLSQPKVNIVVNNRTAIAKWICDNFQYLNRNKASINFSYDNVRKLILSQTRICRSPIPDLHCIIAQVNTHR